ncbi:MAG TPA: toll/interleukin-1 receptor domain-containing protein [Burkholderiales bacterium]|nr:toll/interleukin-1 receptor domain-containing protein [Burkholderiales bacterium]
MTDVFVSYASPDRDLAFRIVAYLEKENIACWVAPRDVPPGLEYGDAILRGIEQSRACVLVLSEHSNDSQFVRKEVERAVSKSKPVLPVRIREVSPSGSIEFFISSSQWIDAWKSPMEQHLPPLVAAIKAIGQPGAAHVRSSTLPPPRRSNMPLIAGISAAFIAAGAAGAWWYSSNSNSPAARAASAGTGAEAASASAPGGIAQATYQPDGKSPAAATPTRAAGGGADSAQEAGTMIISALGLADPKDPKFNGDAAAANAEARADAKRQLVEKVLALYVEKTSLDKNYSAIEQKLLSRAGGFIKTVIQEGAPTAGKDGLIEADTRAVIKIRDVQKSLNQMSKEDRIDFIRNNGDPKISIAMAIRNADTAQELPAARSQLAENVIKERIKSFGFRVWALQGDAPTGPNAKVADFHVQGEVKVKQLSAKLAASGITITKTIVTSWTVKAIDKATGEEIYLNTLSPKAQGSWANEDQALLDIGRLVGEEFSKGFFLQHFNFGAQKTNLNITGLPDAASAKVLLKELRGIRQVLDTQLVADSGKYQLQLAEGSAPDIVQEAVIKPLNAKLGQACFALAGASGSEVNVTFAPACSEAAVRAKLETAPPAGLLSAPESRGKALLKTAARI